MAGVDRHGTTSAERERAMTAAAVINPEQPTVRAWRLGGSRRPLVGEKGEREFMTMILIQLAVLLACIVIGARLCGIALGTVSGIGSLIFVFAFSMPPRKPTGYRPRDHSGGDHRHCDDGGRRRARFSGRSRRRVGHQRGSASGDAGSLLRAGVDLLDHQPLAAGQPN